MVLWTSWSGLRRDPRPHPEERARRNGAADSNGRARVSKDEDERMYWPSCFETHRSAFSPVDIAAFASRCDAPQHEAGPQPARVRTAVHCFRIVTYNENTNLRV